MVMRKTVACERQDGGYAWFIVLGSFISHFCVLGTARSLGILYIELLEKFNQTAVKTAAVSAIFNTLRMLFAPLVSLFCKRFSCRLSMFLGSLIFCSGFVLSAFVTSLWYLNFTYGVICGLGACMLFTPPYIILNQYFDKKKGLANSLGTLGAGAGSVAIPPLIVFLMMEYAYFGGMILLGAVQLHNCIAAALYRPFRASKLNQAVKAVEEVDGDDDETASAAGGYEGKRGTAVTQLKRLEEFSSMLSLSHADEVDNIIHADEMPKTLKKDVANKSMARRLHSQCSSEANGRQQPNKDSVCSNDGRGGEDSEHHDDGLVAGQSDRISGHVDKSEAAAAVKSTESSKDGGCGSNCRERWKSTLQKKVLIFRDTTMLLYLLTIATMPMSHGMVMWFTSDSARINGVDDTSAALLLSYFGVADVIGRVAWGPIFDIPFIRPRRRMIHALLGVIVGTIVICHGFATSYIVFACLICTFGLFEGGYHAQRMAVISEIVDKSMLEESVGITIFFQGVGNFIGPLLAGYSRDTFGNYSLAYFIGGSAQVFVCTLFVVDYIVKNKKQKKIDITTNSVM